MEKELREKEKKGEREKKNVEKKGFERKIEYKKKGSISYSVQFQCTWRVYSYKSNHTYVWAYFSLVIREGGSNIDKIYHGFT